MIELVRFVRDNYLFFAQSGMNLVFVWIGSIAFFMQKKKDKRFGNLIGIAFLIMLLLICPMTAYCFKRLSLDSSNYYQFFYFLPIILIVGYFFVEAYNMGQRKTEKIVMTFIIFFLLFANINTGFTREHIQINTGKFAVNTEVQEITDMLKEYSSITLLAPEKVAGQIMEYGGNIRLIGTPGTVSDGMIVESEVVSNHMVNCVIVDKEIDSSLLSGVYGYQVIGETKNYLVYVG